MKNQTNLKITVFCTFLVLLMTIISCNTQKSISISDDKIETAYNESLKTWAVQKKEHNNSYEYAVGYSSFVGYTATTTIVVKNGKITSRTFAEKEPNEDGRFIDAEKTIYTENELNINTNKKGEKATTMDEIYKVCGTKSLQVNDIVNNIYFTTNDLGLIKSCGYFPKNCMDDCSVGVYISAFKWLE